MTVDRVARGLAAAEERLRAEGLTGAQAFAALRDAVRARMGEAVTARPSALQAVDALPLDGDVDLLGLAYERFFADLFKGRRGQYFTPRPLVELLLDRAGVRPGETVLDPTCGSGGFLVVAARRGARVRGIELDPTLVELARLNLAVAGLPGEVEQGDCFALDVEPVDLVVANPPFSVPIGDPDVLRRYELGRGRRRVPSDQLFCEALERWVRPGGRAAVVLPWSVVVNPSFEAVRERLSAGWHREALCLLPEGVFRPFGGAAGRAVLLWLRRGGSGRTRWAVLRDPGWDVRSIHVRLTSDDERRRLADDAAWEELPDGAWTPVRRTGRGVPLRELARLRTDRVTPARDPQAPFALVELAHVDKATGEVSGAANVAGADVAGARAAIEPGDLLISRLRPELGNVAMARRPARANGPLVGSPEWIVLRPERLPHFTLHALRTPAWRAALPVTAGQTRPRTTPGAVLDSDVPWPGEALAARIDALARDLHARRALLRDRLDALQAALDAFAAGDLDEAGLAERLEALDREEPPAYG